MKKQSSLKKIFLKISKSIGAFFSVLNKKEFVVASLLVLGSVVALTASSFLSSAYFENNIAVSLLEEFNSFNPKLNFSGGIVYYSPIDTKDEIIYPQTEICREMREIFYDTKFLEAYVSGWDDKYSPAQVSINGEAKNFSLLKLPKERYTYTRWTDGYEIPLIFPNATNIRTAPTDIYITLEYANELVSQGLASNIEGLVGKEMHTTYHWNVASEFSTQEVFFIQGILDSSSEEYKRYSNIFGDFFVVNEYYSIPMPTITFFSTQQKGNLLLLFETLLKKYKYETVRNNYSSVVSAYSFQTRISFIGNYDSDLSITKTTTSTEKFQKRINSIFEEFVTKSYLIYSLIYLLANCSFVVATFLSLRRFLVLCIMHSKKATIILGILLTVISFLLGILTKNLFGLASLCGCLSVNNYYGLILAFAEIFIVGIVLMVWLRKRVDKQSA